MTFDGRFWRHAIVLFIALRVADVINAITGLWIIPKGLSQADLGAVLPLLQFGAVLALPVSILVTVFTRMLCTYLSTGEQTKAVGLLADMMKLTLAALCISIGIAACCMPWICHLLRINTSIAGYLAVSYGILMAFLPIWTAALQSLQRFGWLGLIGVISAPLRLGAMYVLLPLLGLSGYFLGQFVPALLTISLATLTLWPLLRLPKSVAWREDRHEMFRYGAKISLGTITGTFSAVVITTLIRTSLTDNDSAAYYLLSRFAEIATYCAATFSTVLFPYVIEGHTQGHTTQTLRNKAMGLIVFGGGLLALLLTFVTPSLFHLIPEMRAYATIAPLAGYLCLSTTLNAVAATYFLHATARNEFHYLWYTVPLTVLSIGFLVSFTNDSLLRMLHLLMLAALLQLLAVALEARHRTTQKNGSLSKSS